ncbi:MULTISPECIES: hypothetical protein [unclassified Cytobacillus]|uniref:hypothetical protein n=1 Tax=unclassified Cytobacillus TaxID=2675268 RepID=UPI001357BFFC|nr:hypothetical protein [Cytobacillus sp. AMY 15.2]KAF0817640.1 hypothetical protein KIS4809_3457 [Bacillus sp. ZZV12-4809]MCM3092175.1 hypothetical protein [Cytobacillus sp. AMY 15.2]
MKKWLKPGFSIFLASLLVLSLALPGYAAGKDGKSKTSNLALEKISEMPKEKKQRVEAALDNPSFKNRSELSKSEAGLVNKVTKSPSTYLKDADIVKDESVLIYGTENPNVVVSNTDGYVEVIEKVDENSFTINGEVHKIQVTSEEDQVKNKEEEQNAIEAYSSSSWVSGGNPGGNWSVIWSGWRNLHFENTIGTYTVGALATIIGLFTLPVLTSAMIGIASILLGSIYTNSSAARLYQINYKHQYPIYKREYYQAYAVWEGKQIYLGYKNIYYHRTPGV